MSNLTHGRICGMLPAEWAVDSTPPELRVLPDEGTSLVHSLILRLNRSVTTGLDYRSPRYHLMVVLFLISAAIPLSARPRGKDRVAYGMGLIINVPFPGSEVTQVVQDVVQNGIIRGTKEYNKDQYVSGATAASSTKVFGAWTEGGKAFYKVRLEALDPRNFKEGGDVGTLAVRYVVQPQDANHTVLRIDARFVEDFRRTMHESNGSVESAEYKDIHDRLDAITLMKAEASEAIQEQQRVGKQESSSVRPEMAPDSAPPTPVPPPAQLSATAPSPAEAPATTLTSSDVAADVPQAGQTLAERLKDLRQQVERSVKSPGAALKSAPFHTASTLQSLPTGTEVLIVITTPYWLGVETRDGQHGWIQRDELGQAP